MNISLILGHPQPGSLNHAIAETALATLHAHGHTVHYHDLYAEGFDPILPYGEMPRGAILDPAVAQHCDEIASADGIIVVHPNWWGQPPAMLKGWIDRVIRPGVAYEFLEGDAGDGVPNGLLRARAALVFNTSNTPRARELDVFGDPLEALWWRCIFDLCGVTIFYRTMYGCVVTSSPEERQSWLDDVAGTVARNFPAQSCG
ncbi:MAG: NAD(P)H-dependent oxidoreductase [Anaerolineae bacterium]|nr:NAD(P)H-dependent oxidoreductase [Anaerolineae bacterium]